MTAALAHPLYDVRAASLKALLESFPGGHAPALHALYILADTKAPKQRATCCAEGNLPAWLISALRAHLPTESNHKAMQRALQLLALPSAAAAGASHSPMPVPDLHSAAAGWHEHSKSSACAAAPPAIPAEVTSSGDALDDRAFSGADASCSGRGQQDGWAEVRALQQRLAGAKHPQVRRSLRRPL